MTEIGSLANLPEHIQIVIATGYIGHSIARSGLRDKERKDELLYGIIVFGLIGYIAYDLFKSKFTHFLVPAIVATIVVIFFACVWRKYGRNWSKLLHGAGVLNEDGTNSVWVGLTQSTHIGPTQISVLLNDGTTLECNDVQSFSDAPFPRYYTDNEGNIGFYVTKVKQPDGTIKEKPTVRDKGWGDRLTYVPSTEISRVMIRFKSKNP